MKTTKLTVSNELRELTEELYTLDDVGFLGLPTLKTIIKDFGDGHSDLHSETIDACISRVNQLEMILAESAILASGAK